MKKQTKIWNRSLVVRVTLLFFICCLVSIFIYSLYLSRMTYSFIKEQITANASSLCYSTAQNLDVVIDKMNHSAILLLNRVEVAEAIIALDQDDSLSALEQLSYWSVLSTQTLLSTTTADYYHITFYGQDGDFIYGENVSANLFEQNTINGPEDFQQTSYILLSPNESDFVVGTADEGVYVLVRAIGNVNYSTPIGYLAVMCESNDFQKFITNQYNSFDASDIYPFALYLEDERGNIIATANENSDIVLDDTNSYSTVQALENTDWSIVMRIPTSYYVAQFFSTMLSSFLLPSFLILGRCISIALLLRHYLSPLNQLSHSMAAVTKGDYSEHLDASASFDDIEVIFNGYNQMLTQIDTLINSVYRNQITMQTYQLKLLKAQINPHFLYNTLQAIEALGEINDVPEVQEAASLLGDLLHYNLKESEQVTLQAELHSAEIYLKIHQIRFYHQLKFFVQIEPEVENCIVEKFILQPLIENSILHGFENMSRDGEISICCYRDGAHLHIDLFDDGTGIPTAQLERLQAQLQIDSTEIATNHIGILNVHRRLSKLYGAPYGLTLKSTPSHGTLIRIILPYQATL
ncbi:MAG: histidine kinase [Faecalibacterium sp.]